MVFQSALFTALLSPCLAFSQIGVELPSSPLPEMSGPTLEQTVDWIVKKINAIPASDRQHMRYTAVGNGCIIQINRYYSYARTNPLDETRKFNLKDIDKKYISVRTDVYDGIRTTHLWADTLGDAKVVEMVLSNSRRHMSAQVAIENMDVDIEYAESLKNAFIHAQKLCAQKASAEKAIKPKDLF